MIKPSTKVYRQQAVEGFSIPAIIHNSSYFFVDLDVYEDGRVECWNFEDFDHFKQDVARGWVALEIPDNKEISIHNLGSWAIANGNWTFSKENFADYVLSLVKELNPRMENLYKYTEKKINGVRIGESGKGKVYKDQKKDSFFSEKIGGDSVNLFYKMGDLYWLTKVNIFSDDSVHLCRLENNLEMSLGEFEKLIQEKVVLTAVPDNARVHIYGLGSFDVQAARYVTNIDSKLSEVRDIKRQLNGEPSSIDICREAYLQYLNNPTNELKERLKITYESVPDHQKRYVGDMDTKDIEVRMIIYGEQEIENWSHYRLAKARGEELPTITIPKPNAERTS